MRKVKDLLKLGVPRVTKAGGYITDRESGLKFEDAVFFELRAARKAEAKAKAERKKSREKKEDKTKNEE